MLNAKEKSGMLGEICAARMLRERGYEIIDANYRSRLGEIDIIASGKGFIVFAEVKTRGENPIAAAREAVDENKQRRIVKTAALYLEQNPVDLQPRFDVIEVMLDAQQNPVSINHIENAFDSDI